jgi:hypothetical protein
MDMVQACAIICVMQNTKHKGSKINISNLLLINWSKLSNDIYTHRIPIEAFLALLYQCINLPYFLLNQCKFHWATQAEHFVVPESINCENITYSVHEYACYKKNRPRTECLQ